MSRSTDMRHFVVVSGNPGDASATGDRIQDYFRSAYPGSIVERQEVGDESHQQVLIRAASEASRLPAMYIDRAAGCWLVVLGAWFARGERDAGLENSIEEICAAGDILGHAAFDGLDAAFCIASGTLRQRQFRIVTDRIGTQHVYAGNAGGADVVSSSSLALAAASKATWNPTGVQEFLATGTIFGARTLFDGIAKLPGATQTAFAAGKPARTTQYWRISDSHGSFEAGTTIERLAAALQASIGAAAQRLGRPSLSLTGGLDSRIIFAAALKTGIPFETFTSGEPDNADVVIARKIAARFGIRHRHLDLSPVLNPVDWASWRASLLLCDGEYDAFEYANIYAAHKLLSTHADFSINGSGGEFCKGYWWELLWPEIGKAAPLDIGKVIDKRFLVDNWAARVLAPGSQVDLRQSLVDTANESNEGLSGYPNTLQMDNVYLALRMHRWQGRIASATAQIWPTVSPFMFREPMEIAFSAPPNDRIRNRMSRRLNEFLNPALAGMPIDARGPALPLRPGTALRFLPAAWTVLEKVAGKVRKKIPVRPGNRSATRPPGRAVRLQHYEGLEQFRDTGSWQTLQFYDSQKLAGFLEKYFEDDRPLDRPFGRLITLEAVARHLDARFP